jgi:2-polyprenyl-3-methyl-5-hydroxy-6-metoxy-1,4-benzoquinol methylase
MIEDKDETLLIHTSLSPEELIARLAQVRLKGGWRHKINFSNGFSTDKLETGKPWSDRPLNKIKMVDKAFPDFAKQGGRALDVGSNIGYNSLYLASRYSMSVTGIDVTQGHVNVSKTFAELGGVSSVEFKLANAETYLEKGAFDLVVHFGTLYHLRNVIRALETASANLRAGGFLALETVCDGPPGSMHARYVRGFNNDPSNWWAVGDGALRSILDFCGFSEPQEVFRWTHPSLDGMYRIIWATRKVKNIETAYDDASYFSPESR